MKVTVDYDPMSGNINYNGAMYYVGVGLSFEPANSETQAQQQSDVVKLSNNGMTADDLIKMREAGVI